MQHGPSYLPSEGIIEDIIMYDAVAISSYEGETIALKDKVSTKRHVSSRLNVRRILYIVTIGPGWVDDHGYR